MSPFFLWRSGAPAATEFDPGEALTSFRGTGYHYFCGVLANVQANLPDRDQDLRFLLTWNVDSFDQKFRDAVVILVGDEKYQVPSWASEARAIFKTGGLRRNTARATLGLPAGVAWRVALRDARNIGLAVWRRLRRGRHDPELPPMFEVPMGDYALVDVPYVPINERPVDVFFAGSTGDAGRLNLRPRVASRKLMFDALDSARSGSLALAVDQVAFTNFGDASGALDVGEYSARLMRAKIALCPRGNFDETFRLFEAARSGCVAITEPLPQRWYYEDAPAIELKRWSDLDTTLASLLSDPAGLEEIAARHQRWWRRCISEEILAEYVCARVGSHADATKRVPPP
jgi:hypothetical protein